MCARPSYSEKKGRSAHCHARGWHTGLADNCAALAIMSMDADDDTFDARDVLVIVSTYRTLIL